MTLLCGYIAPFMETMWDFSIFAGQLPRGLWKQFRREIKGLQNRFQAWMIKWTFCKTDFTELITTGWLRLSHINKLKSRKIKRKHKIQQGRVSTKKSRWPWRKVREPASVIRDSQEDPTLKPGILCRPIQFRSETCMSLCHTPYFCTLKEIKAKQSFIMELVSST